MSTISRGWLVLDITDSAFMVTAINATGLIPTLVFSLVGGVIADRMNKRLVLITSDAISLVTLGILSVLILADLIQLWHIFGLTLIHGSSFAIGMPSRASLVSNLVSSNDMSSGVALFTTIFSAGQMVGPGVAGFLIDSYGMVTPFITATSILILAILLLLKLEPIVVVGQVKGEKGSSILESILEGLDYVRKHGILFGLIFMGAAATVFALPYQTLLPVFARDVLEVGASGLGWLGAMTGAGAIVGSITVASLDNTKFMKVLMLVGSIALGCLIVLFAISTDYLLSRVILFCLGFSFQIFMTSNFTFVQLIAPEYIRGRVLSIRMIAFGLSPIGMILLGTSTEFFGPVIATAITGAMSVVLLASIIIFIPSLRHVDRST